MKLSLIAAAVFAALLAGCAAEGTYYGDYGAPYYGYGYGYDYGPTYGPTYYDGPDFSFYYRSGDGGHRWNGSGRTWQGSSSFQGSAQTPSRSASRTVTQPRARSHTRVAQGERRIDRSERAARQSTHVASQTRTGPDREHGGGGG